MKTAQASTTAQGVALVRALESARPATERVCYDPLARRLIAPMFYLLGKLFAGYAERRAPGLMGFLVARCRYIDDYLLERLDDGIEQLVILGAGLDSRAYRICPLASGSVRVFEVDHPATQRGKLDRLRRVLGALPLYVTFASIDLAVDDLDRLYEFGYRREAKTLFIWEGVVYYLPAQAVDQTLAWVRRNAASGSSIIFDYIDSSALTAAEKRGEITRMERARRFTGEGLVFGIPEGEVEAFLRARGYSAIVDLSAGQLERLYFRQAAAGRGVAPVYGIVHAEVG